MDKLLVKKINHEAMNLKDLHNLPSKFSRLIDKLQKGNNRFINNNCNTHNFNEERLNTAKAQNPEIIVLTCSDSRVTPEFIFDTPIGNLFVIRCAGNIITKSALGSIEFALLSFQCPLFLILGHQSCGAIISVHNKVLPTENIAYLAEYIEPAIKSASNQNFTNDEAIEIAIKENVFLQMKKSVELSQILKNNIENGDLAIIGAYYYLDNGKVELLEKAFY